MEPIRSRLDRLPEAHVEEHDLLKAVTAGGAVRDEALLPRFDSMLMMTGSVILAYSPGVLDPFSAGGRSMQTIVGGILPLVLALSVAAAPDQRRDKPATPGEQYQALLKEYRDAEEA